MYSREVSKTTGNFKPSEIGNIMTFELTPVDAPAAGRGPNEYDALIPGVVALQEQHKWGSLTVPEKDAETFRRKYRDAANRAGYSAKFAETPEAVKGQVTLTFTIQPKITRVHKPKDAE